MNIVCPKGCHAGARTVCWALWRRRQRTVGWKAITPVAVLANWLLFITFVFTGQIGGFGSHYMTSRLADGFLLVSVLLVIASLLAYVGRWQLSLASILMLALWMGSAMVA
jgi:hypothetical protein